MCKTSGKIAKCIGILCEDCKFYSPEGCHENIAEWANAEYVEKPKISEKDRAFLSFIKDSYQYIARDIAGILRLYNARPSKDARCLGDSIYPLDVNLPMVKWEDEKPWLIEDLKKLEVVEEYE